VENFVDYGWDVAEFGQNRRGQNKRAAKPKFVNPLLSISSELEPRFFWPFGVQPAQVTQKLKFPQFAVSLV
jgi:hypothetical protein